ncbi:hypothetical protein PFICI_13754 [Pestalotiopsis fici W106-1]|uniref:Helicase ATP-binding domain-containing protein n=1 Tax=Pestalotiopsis fici (strain W106-1 / CGMCC3.15140) TaxID=1229662 RepID=W3WJ30_PESFW|nr:uncharacterized protein PFICI_13754 [Pestalotiopsis fici W106-1]ETS73888.1 hypothetical protein PFICI_13754 [Pestalotiopsis fici W106-1]
MCKKFCEVLRNEEHLPKYLDGFPELQSIVVYEQIGNMLAQPFNRYSWSGPTCIDPPKNIADYNGFRHRCLGQFFTTPLAGFMTDDTADAEDCEDNGPDVDDEDDGEDPLGAKKKTKSTHTWYTLYLCPIENLSFGRVICDEAHHIRNANNAYSRLIGLIPRETVLLMTATPTLNRLKDIAGVLNQVWKTSKLCMVDDARARLMRDDFDIQAVKHTQDSSDPTKAFSPFVEGTAPEEIEALAPDMENRTPTSDWVYQQATKCVQFRRTMRDGVKVVFPGADGEEPEEKIFYPGQNVPPHEIIMEELGFKGRTGDQVTQMTRMTNALLSKLNTAGGAPEPTLPDTSDAAALAVPAEADGRVDITIHRLLLLTSFDLHVADIFNAEDAISQGLDLGELRRAMGKKASKPYAGPQSTVESEGLARLGWQYLRKRPPQVSSDYSSKGRYPDS